MMMIYEASDFKIIRLAWAIRINLILMNERIKEIENKWNEINE